MRHRGDGVTGGVEGHPLQGVNSPGRFVPGARGEESGL